MLQESEEILPTAGIEEGNSSITWEDSGIKTRGQRAASPFFYQSNPTALVRNSINGAAVLHSST